MTARTIFLRSFETEPGRRPCSCGKRIRWAVTQAGKPIAIEMRAKPQAVAGGGFALSTDDVHWAHCPHRKLHRREQTTAPSERID